MDQSSKVQLHTGSLMPIIGLGTWELDDTPTVVSEALELGYRMIDTSGDYGTQPGIADGIKLSDIDRENLYIVTKVEETEDSYKSTLKNLEELQLDYADLVLIHRPPEDGVGEHLWEGLRQARDEGLIRDIGVSNYSEEQLLELAESSGELPVVNQIEWSPFGWSSDMMRFCRINGIVIQAYSPLTRGERFDEEVLLPICEKYGKSQAQILIRWCLQLGIVPLPKANLLKHLQENIDVFDFQLDQEDMLMLDAVNEDYSALADRPVYQMQ